MWEYVGALPISVIIVFQGCKFGKNNLRMKPRPRNFWIKIMKFRAEVPIVELHNVDFVNTFCLGFKQMF